jgi:hypothetical protein
MSAQVTGHAERPNFQAGHAGSIPVIRSYFSLFKETYRYSFGRHSPCGGFFVPHACHEGV